MSIARTRPSLSAPIRTVTRISWRLFDPVKLSCRVNTIRAGLPVFIVTTAGNSSLHIVCLAPNPPPIRGLTTRTRLCGMPSARAICRRQWNGIWVEVSTFSRLLWSSQV